MKALVYCRRVGTEDIYRYLKVNFLTLNILKDIISKRKAKNKGLVGDYRALHQRHDLELKTLSVVLNNSSNLQRILAKSQPKRLNKRRRRALKKNLPLRPPKSLRLSTVTPLSSRVIVEWSGLFWRVHISYFLPQECFASSPCPSLIAGL